MRQAGFWLVTLLTLALVGRGEAQVVQRLWQVDKGGQAIYVVRISAMASASMHEYVVGGSVLVTEVTIGTLGSTQARFYHMQPVTAATGGGVGGLTNIVTQRGQQVAERVAEVTGAPPVWRGVIKDYPTSTHAHTVEYRVESLELLRQLLNSAIKAMETDRSERFRLD